MVQIRRKWDEMSRKKTDGGLTLEAVMQGMTDGPRGRGERRVSTP